jgi:hypothetical protein
MAARGVADSGIALFDHLQDAQPAHAATAAIRGPLIVRGHEVTDAPMTAAPDVQHELRRRLRVHLYDESGATPAGTAIYSLADPRDVRASRYIGQTAQPRRRLLQHVRTARVWLPEETPWWVKEPRLRPLYGWIRELYQQDGRLPMMIVHAWVEAERAQLAEREHIRLCLECQLPLLNLAICHVGGAREAKRT